MASASSVNEFCIDDFRFCLSAEPFLLPSLDLRSGACGANENKRLSSPERFS